MRCLTVLVVLIFTPSILLAQDEAKSGADNASNQNRPQQGRRGPGGFGGPIELGRDDKQVYPDPDDSIVAKQDGIAHGKLEMIEYESKTVGTKRKANIYTPPGYSAENKYPVL